MNTCKTCRCTGYIGVDNTEHDQVKRFEDIRRCLDCQLYDDDIAAQKAYIRQKKRLISYSLWERLYRPLCDETESYINFACELEVAEIENRLWTEFYEDHDVWLEPRFSSVSSTAHYITEKPCRLNIVVDKMLTHETIRLSRAEAAEVLLSLHQSDYPIEDYIDERQFKVHDGLMDEYHYVFVKLCAQQRKPLADTLTLTW